MRKLATSGALRGRQVTLKLAKLPGSRTGEQLLAERTAKHLAALTREIAKLQQAMLEAALRPAAGQEAEGSAHLQAHLQTQAQVAGACQAFRELLTSRPWEDAEALAQVRLESLHSSHPPDATREVALDHQRFFSEALQAALHGRHLDDGQAGVLLPGLAQAANQSAAAHQADAPDHLAGLSEQGEQAKLRWVERGEVVSAAALASAWGLTPQALGPAAARGELFSVRVKGARYYPREFLKLPREPVAAVCRALAPMSGDMEKLLFWKRGHGALGGRTVAQVLQGRPEGLQQVLHLAEALTAQATTTSAPDAQDSAPT